jgi:hypothetical protein
MTTEEMITACTSRGMNVDFTAAAGVWIWHFDECGHAHSAWADTLTEAFKMAQKSGWINV